MNIILANGLLKAKFNMQLSCQIVNSFDGKAKITIIMTNGLLNAKFSSYHDKLAKVKITMTNDK